MRNERAALSCSRKDYEIMNTFKIKVSQQLSRPETRFYAFAVFATVVFFMGGSSRDDVQSLLILRPLAVLFLAYALSVMKIQQWQGRLFPVYLACALATLMALQLVPLAPSIWTGLPGRSMFADIATIAGIEQPWRPLTLSPSRTINSLFSVAIPVAAMMLYLNLDKSDRAKALTVILALSLMSGLWAIFQLVGGARGPLYLYRITNDGSGVGLLANRNHQAILLASTIMILGWYASSRNPREKLSTFKTYTSIAAIFIIVPLIFITGSRAGLLLMIPGLLGALTLIYFGSFNFNRVSNRRHSKLKRKEYRFVSRRNIILITLLLFIVCVVISTIYFSRSLALERLIADTDSPELRVRVVPVLLKMLQDYFPLGSGFGTFEHVYKIYEPLELLNPSYLNQAHNDWLQLPIEGGAPILLIAFSALLWFAIQFGQMVRNWGNSKKGKYRALTASIIMTFFLVGSIVDYPLRVPSLIFVFAVCACIFNDEVRLISGKADRKYL